MALTSTGMGTADYKAFTGESVHLDAEVFPSTDMAQQAVSGFISRITANATFSSSYTGRDPSYVRSVQNGRGLVAWSHGRYVYMLTAPSLDVMNAFVGQFPY
jgi:hypothetical protein